MAGLGRPFIKGTVGVLAVAVGILASAPVAAQFRPNFQIPSQRTPEEELLERLPTEPRLLLQINDARELIASMDYEAAIDTLQPLLEGGEDFYGIEVGQPAGSTLGQVETLLRAMPVEAIETYRRRYEPLAAQKLVDAQAHHDLHELMEIVRIYPLTFAAAQATQSAGEIAFDQGETALAARLWERRLLTIEAGSERTTLLIRIAQSWTLAGQPDAAAVHVRELSTLAQTSPIDYEGKLLTPPATADAAWLSKVFGPVPPLIPQRVGDWRMIGGHPRRWGTGAMVSPIQRGRWAYPLIDQYDMYVSGREMKFQTLLTEIDTRYQRNAQSASSKPTPLVIGAPLVVGDTVLVQGMGSLKALDARTGQMRWSGVAQDETFFYWAQRNYVDKGDNSQHDNTVELYLGQRAWLNQTAASLASDGQQAYAVSGTGMVGAYRASHLFMGRTLQPPPRELVPPGDNRLLAYDISTGLLKWELGGAVVATPLDEDGQQTAESRRLGGVFFLGAPLPVDGQLFTLAEDRGQIRLFALSPETGEAEWSLPLLNPTIGIVSDEKRRMFGLSPAYAGGLLICPTGAGVVVAVDPLLRRVKWIQQYQAGPPHVDPRAMAMMQFPGRRDMRNGEAELALMIANRRWLDSTPILIAGRALLPASDADRLLCLDIESGKTLWDVPRGEGLFIAACTERQCLIVGEHSIKAIKLSDQKTAWSTEIPTPSGRGVVSGGQYLLPVSTNEILAIEMKTGHILARTSVDGAHRTGSLVAAGGQLVMQSTSEVIGLRSLSEVSTEIARSMNDPAARALALSEQGELFLFQGKEAEAVALLQESLSLQESAPARKLLVWSLLERLKTDFAGTRGQIAELKKTVTDPVQLRLLNRLNAEGLEKAGEPVAAFREYLEIVQDSIAGNTVRNDSLIEYSTDLRVREDRWLRGRLGHLYSLGDESLRQQMRDAIRELSASLDVRAKSLWAEVLGIDLAPELHLELALANGVDAFQAQRVLWTLSESSDPRLAGPAVAKLLRNELSMKRTKFIKPLLSQLQHDLVNVECEPGLTGVDLLKQLQQRFHEDSAIGPFLSQWEHIPDIQSFETGNAAVTIRERMIYPVLGGLRGPYAESSFSFDSTPSPSTYISDASGKSEILFNHDAIGDGTSGMIRYVQTDPQLALLVFRNSLAVIGPMDSNRNRQQVRFHAPLTQTPNFGNRQRAAPQPKPGGVRDIVYPATGNTYLGNVGPLTYDTLCYMSEDNLYAVRPTATDGKIQWQRTAVPPGSEICADSEYVVLIPPQHDRLIVLRSADGTQLAQRPFPAGLEDRQRADWGRLFLIKRPAMSEPASSATTTWAMYDPVTDREAWSQSFPLGTIWTPVEGADLAFLEPDGTLHFVDDQTGRTKWKAKLPAQSIPHTEFAVHSDAQHLYVHTADAPPVAGAPRSGQLSPFGSRSIKVNGLVAALDRHAGTIVWSKPLTNQTFHPNLPSGSGVLCYSVQQASLHSDQEGATPSVTSFLFLNRQTGVPVFSKELPAAGNVEAWSRLPSGVLWLRVSGQDFRLSWKKAITAAEAQADAEAEGQAPDQEEPLPDLPGAAPGKME